MMDYSLTFPILRFEEEGDTVSAWHAGPFLSFAQRSIFRYAIRSGDSNIKKSSIFHRVSQ